MIRESHDEVHAVRPALRAWTLAALAIATIAAFSGLHRADWILFDDPVYVLNNVHISRGLTLDGLRWIFHHPHGGNFHPLTSISHMLDAQVFGLGPRGPHLENLALHVANVLLVCLVLARYTGCFWRSAIVAALFGLHPLHVESVAWISERKDVLSTLFFLLALDAWRRWVEHPTRGRYGLVCAWFVLGLLAKPMLVTLPFVLILLDVWPLRRVTWPIRARDVRPLVSEKWPLFAITIVSAGVTYFVQHAAGAVMSSQALPLWPRILNALASYGRYLWLTVWPHDLAVYYPHTGSTSTPLVIASSTVLIVVSVCAWKLRAKQPSFFTGWSWFVGTLVPVIGIVQVGAQSFADRYTYIPSIGLFAAVVWVLADAVKRSSGARTAVLAALSILLFACGVATARQVSLWKDTKTLFGHAIAVTEHNAVAQQNFGNALLMSGDVDAAMKHLEEALRIVPDFPDAHNNLGSALGSKGRFEEAIAHFRTALLEQDTAGTHYNLGFALVQAGRGDEALAEYARAIELEPDFADAHAALGAALAARGRLDEAERHLERALEFAPEKIETHRSMAITLTLQGRVEEGIAEYQAVLKRAPQDLDALNNIAWIRATHSDAAHRDGATAVRLAEMASSAAIEPNHVLNSTLAAAYAEVGRFEDAENSARRAIELARSAKDLDAVHRYEIQLEHYLRRQAFRP